MRLARGRLFFALAMLVGLSVACGDTPTVTPHPPDPDTCESFLEEIIPDDWKDPVIQRVDPGDEELPEEWIVFYREDGAPDSSRNAVVYRLITDRYQSVSDRTQSFVAYDLWLPCDGSFNASVCQCDDCRAERADLLSVYSGPELIVWSECDERSGLRAYRWVIETMRYELVAYFDGDSIDMGKGWVVIDNDTSGGSGLVSRCTYFPLGSVRPFAVAEGMSYPECEITFPKDVPDDVLTSPYPEEVVMALYSQIQYTDTTKIQPYFADSVRESIWEWGVELLGCPEMSTPIASVRITAIEISETRRIARSVRQNCLSEDLDAAAEGLAIVVVEACCEYMGGSDCEPGTDRKLVPVKWVLAWEEDGWRVQGLPTLSDE